MRHPPKQVLAKDFHNSPPPSPPLFAAKYFCPTPIGQKSALKHPRSAPTTHCPKTTKPIEIEIGIGIEDQFEVGGLQLAEPPSSPTLHC
jgi:hypothetical protein